MGEVLRKPYACYTRGRLPQPSCHQGRKSAHVESRPAVRPGANRARDTIGGTIRGKSDEGSLTDQRSVGHAAAPVSDVSVSSAPRLPERAAAEARYRASRSDRFSALALRYVLPAGRPLKVAGDEFDVHIVSTPSGSLPFENPLVSRCAAPGVQPSRRTRSLRSRASASAPNRSSDSPNARRNSSKRSSDSANARK